MDQVVVVIVLVLVEVVLVTLAWLSPRPWLSLFLPQVGRLPSLLARPLPQPHLLPQAPLHLRLWTWAPQAPRGAPLWFLLWLPLGRV